MSTKRKATLSSVSAGLLCLAFFASSTTAQELSDLVRIKPGRSRAVTSANPDPNSNKDRIGVIEPGKTVVLADILKRVTSFLLPVIPKDGLLFPARWST